MITHEGQRRSARETLILRSLGLEGTVSRQRKNQSARIARDATLENADLNPILIQEHLHVGYASLKSTSR